MTPMRRMTTTPRTRTNAMIAALLLTAATATMTAQPVADGIGHVGIGTLEPDAAAILDLTSTTAGFLTPRMTTAQRNAIAAPTNGLLIYNTDNNSFEHYIGAPVSDWTTMLSDYNVAMQVWLTGGNPGTTAGLNYLGTTDDEPLELHVDEAGYLAAPTEGRSEEHTSELQSQSNLVC